MQTASKKVINGWAMFDWANSVYNLVITTTFFPIYFTAVAKNAEGSNTVTFLGRNFVNSSLYNYCLALAYLLIAIAYPIVTSVADTRGNKKNFMRFFTIMGSLGCSALFFFKGIDTLGLGIVAFMLAAMGFVGSLVFYNAYLPEIAAPEDRDRISAKGFSYGYIGSVIMQLIGFALVTLMPDKGFAIRLTFLLVGIWWFGFAQITFARLPKIDRAALKKVNVFTDGFYKIKYVFGEVGKLPVLKRFLRAFFFYSMGVQTVMLAATLIGSQLLGLSETKLIVTVVLIQIVAIAGAILISRLSEKYGNMQVLIGLVIFWVIICIAGYFTAQFKENGGDPEYGFYGLAIGVGLIMGGIQSLSRSTYSKLMPETKETSSFFSYYDITEKIAIVIGMFSFGYITEISGMKNSLLALIVFFGIGFIFLITALCKQEQLKIVEGIGN